MLDRVATYKEKTEALKAKIKKALTYPIAVIAVAIVVTGVLLIKVVPQFAEHFPRFWRRLAGLYAVCASHIRMGTELVVYDVAGLIFRELCVIPSQTAKQAICRLARQRLSQNTDYWQRGS